MDSPPRVEKTFVHNRTNTIQFLIFPWWNEHLKLLCIWKSHKLLQHIYPNLNWNGALSWFYLGPKQSTALSVGVSISAVCLFFMRSKDSCITTRGCAYVQVKLIVWTNTETSCFRHLLKNSVSSRIWKLIKLNKLNTSDASASCSDETTVSVSQWNLSPTQQGKIYNCAVLLSCRT